MHMYTAGMVTAGLAESNDSLPPGLWLILLMGWLPRDCDWLRALCLTSNMGNFTSHLFGCVILCYTLCPCMDLLCFLHSSVHLHNTCAATWWLRERVRIADIARLSDVWTMLLVLLLILGKDKNRHCIACALCAGHAGALLMWEL